MLREAADSVPGNGIPRDYVRGPNRLGCIPRLRLFYPEYMKTEISKTEFH
jgi:hypothetical protein